MLSVRSVLTLGCANREAEPGDSRGGAGDIIVTMGNDETDEDVFELVPETAWTIKVGLGDTKARNKVQNVGQPRDPAAVTYAVALSPPRWLVRRSVES